MGYYYLGKGRCGTDTLDLGGYDVYGVVGAGMA
jgi:hypothetical protein